MRECCRARTPPATGSGRSLCSRASPPRPKSKSCTSHSATLSSRRLRRGECCRARTPSATGSGPNLCSRPSPPAPGNKSCTAHCAMPSSMRPRRRACCRARTPPATGNGRDLCARPCPPAPNCHSPNCWRSWGRSQEALVPPSSMSMPGRGCHLMRCELRTGSEWE